MDYLLLFLTGFLGSMHCVGMCGAIVLACSTGGNDGGRFLSALSHVAYNSGRVASYAAIGGVAGLLGRAMGSLQVVGPWLSIVLGVMMILSGLLLLDFFHGWCFRQRGKETFLRRFHLQVFRDLLALRTMESRLYIGLLTPLLPCGLLASMFLMAAASGSALNGVLTMLIFGTGTVPALFVTGLATSYISTRFRRYAGTLAGATVILMGAMILLRGLGVPMPFMGMSHEGKMENSPIHQHHLP